MKRVAYDKLFLAHPTFLYKNEMIGGLSIYLKYEIISLKTLKEVFSEDLLLLDKKNRVIHIEHFIKCSFDEKELVKITIQEKELEERGYKVKVLIDSYTKEMDFGFLESVFIEKEEFFDILENNKKYFDNKDNKPTQSTSYYLIEEK